MKNPGLSTITRIVILTAFYFLGGLLGKRVSFLSGSFELIWPPFGLALAAILLYGYGYWPVAALGTVLLSVVSQGTFNVFTCGAAIGSTVGAVLCAWLLERLVRFRPAMDRVRDVAGFVGLACLLGTTVNAAFDVVGLGFQQEVVWEDMFSRLLEWWVPNAMAGLVVTPVIVAWGTPSQTRWSRSQVIEAVLCFGGLAAGTMVSFNSWYVYGVQNYPLAYLPYPFLVWGALRFGQRGATTGTLVVSSVALWALLLKRGPFVTQSERDSLMLIGSYIGILAITNMLLAAVAAERETAVQSVRESERRYRAIVQDQTDLIWRFAPDGTLTFVNDAYCEFHGTPLEKLLGIKYFAVPGREEQEIPLEFFNHLPTENPVISYDSKVTFPDGRMTWHQCSTRRLVDELGRTVEFQSVARDVTRRKLAEQEIRQAEARLRGILTAMVDGVVVMDAQGRITSFNPAAEKLFSRGEAEAIGHRFVEFLPPVDQAMCEAFLNSHQRGQGAKVAEIAVLDQQGNRVPVELAVSEVLLAGVPMLVSVVRDISDRKQMEDQIRQAHKMEAIGRLAGGIAHDFNNLIQAIIGYTDLLMHRTDASDPNRETLGQIEKSAERAASLTSHLLAFSRKQVFRPRLISLNAVVTGMTDLLARLIGENIQLAIQTGVVNGSVRADPSQIEQVILNLALNARDAMPQAGQLKIATSSMELRAPLDGFSTDFVPGAYVVLSIQDNGCGMTPEQKTHLFEPFYTTKETGKGTGLGLSIVYGIVRQSGGEIVCESAPGQGTCFRIFLPGIAAPPEEIQAVPAKPSEAARGETILLVEDGEIVRAMLTQVLEGQGYTVLAAVDGHDAMAVAETYPRRIHLVVTDLVMPRMSGRALAERLRLGNPQLRVLFISGYTDDLVIRQGRIDATSDFLQKPFRPEVLLEKARKLLDSLPTEKA